MKFDLIENTPVVIDSKENLVRFENGMTGIGSRRFWINDEEYGYNAVRQTDDITQGNHSLYLIKWRDTPWDKVYLFISEKYVPDLLSEDNRWREPKKIEVLTQSKEQ
jgi:hypothetical protein